MKLLESAKTFGLQSLDLSRWFGKPAQTDQLHVLQKLCEDILNSDGEYSTLLLSEKFFATYETLSDAEKLQFFTFLGDALDVQLAEYKDVLAQFESTNSTQNYEQLIEHARSKRRILFSRLNLAPNATKKIVDLRSDLLNHIRFAKPEHGGLGRVNLDLLFLLRDWFNRGFLDMQHIDWQTPADVLEKIISYEAVHTMSSWSELRQRLAPEDKYCYAFFHPSMPGEPLVFIELSLTKQLPSRISEVIGEDAQHIDPDDAECAIFYSISNCHRGLSGVSFGNFLIKQVVAYFQIHMPHIKTFATISPVPGFTKWMKDSDPDASRPTEVLAAEYFMSAKNKHGYPYDPVARFHLRNGAELHRLLPMANLSESGKRQSQGLMVNYLYRPDELAINHEEYVHAKKVKTTEEIRKLLK